MTTTITIAGTPRTGALLGYQSSRPSGNIVHQIPGSNTPAVTIGPVGLRTGTLEVGFSTEAAVVAVENALLDGTVATLIDTTFASVNMSFIVHGDLVRTLETDAKKLWSLSIEFQETS